jgi:hypothetical protein
VRGCARHFRQEHLVGDRGTPEYRLSFTVNEMAPGRCPLAWIDEAKPKRDLEPQS